MDHHHHDVKTATKVRFQDTADEAQEKLIEAADGGGGGGAAAAKDEENGEKTKSPAKEQTANQPQESKEPEKEPDEKPSADNNKQEDASATGAQPLTPWAIF